MMKNEITLVEFRKLIGQGGGADVMDAMNRAETGAVKKFVSSRVDRYRPPYGRTIEGVNAEDFECSIFCHTGDPDD